MANGTTSTIRWPKLWLRPKYFLFGFVGLMFVYVLSHNESFLVRPADPEWAQIASFKWWLLPHVLAGCCALLLGPMWQEVRRTRPAARGEV